MKPPPSQFGADITNTAHMICTKLAGRAVIRVVSRCNEAQENNNLDLSECQLIQVPDAVYHLMRHTELKACNLSKLNLSNNQMSKLPDELADLTELETLDLSHNAFINLPGVVYKMPKLITLAANSNHIIEVDVDRLTACRSLGSVDLRENPLPRNTESALQNISRIRVILSPRELEEWEDLTI